MVDSECGRLPLVVYHFFAAAPAQRTTRFFRLLQKRVDYWKWSWTFFTLYKNCAILKILCQPFKSNGKIPKIYVSLYWVLSRGENYKGEGSGPGNFGVLPLLWWSASAQFALPLVCPGLPSLWTRWPSWIVILHDSTSVSEVPMCRSASANCESIWL